MVSRRFALGLTMLLFWLGIAHAADIYVRLVYLRNGKPAAGQQIVLYEGKPSLASTAHLKATTSSNGVAIFHLSDPLPKTVWVDPENGRITGCAWEDQLPLSDVMKQGIIIGVDGRFGSSCKGDRRAIELLAAKPGEIVIFVRKLTAFDNLRNY